jgi:redox-sensitive bicupin YhaK (pirin superfamily)
MKKILGVYNSPEAHWVGNGFLVNSLFSYNDLGKELSPFLLLDHAAPTKYRETTGSRGVGQHPHRGFETVTIVYQGEVEHRDSTGSGGVIGPGDVQWMTAASGILHEEFHSKEFSRTGGTMEMVQLWVNLPAKDKMAAPGYQTLLNKDIPVVLLADNARGAGASDRGSLRWTGGLSAYFQPDQPVGYETECWPHHQVDGERRPHLGAGNVAWCY